MKPIFWFRGFYMYLQYVFICIKKIPFLPSMVDHFPQSSVFYQWPEFKKSSGIILDGILDRDIPGILEPVLQFKTHTMMFAVAIEIFALRMLLFLFKALIFFLNAFITFEFLFISGRMANT